jgi:enediyne biosynthesis protein E4
LWMDFDNDGQKDLFISNGIPKRLNDMDYINFIYNDEVQQKIRNNDMQDKDMALMNKFPEIKIPNKFYLNKKELNFMDMKDAIKNNQPSYSNGAVYADFDNDGDMDVVVNNINDPVLLYENKKLQNSRDFVSIQLKGSGKNINAVGSKIVLFRGDHIETYEKNPARGFMSSMEIPIHIGLRNTSIDSSFLIWPDNSFQKITLDTLLPNISFTYKTDLPKFDYSIITSFKKNSTLPVSDVTKETSLNYIHTENPFNEFDREPLIPHMVSTEGPALAVADINKDGLEDVFVGASKIFHNAIFLQQPGGKFIKTVQPELFKDSMYEDVDASWADVNSDGNTDLIIATGGNEYYGKDEHLLPRIYLNDGKANFIKLFNAFKGIYVTASCIVGNDFNGDGFIDLFLGGRAVPWNYGETPPSYLLQNDGTGKFIDVTDKYAKGLSKIGMVTNAVWADIDKDGDKDLITSCEWGGITAFINAKGNFTKKELTDKKGWWNFVLPVDIDNDGDMDLIAGNLGLNSRLRASAAEPVRLYFSDFDDNGKKEQVLTYYLQHKEITFANKDELQRQMPMIKKKFIYAEDFAKASLNDIFGADKINSAAVTTADYFNNAILINEGNLQFSTQSLPWEAQFTSYHNAQVVNANHDSLPDIFLAGNYYGNNIHNGRYDADYGTLLINKGKEGLQYESLKNLTIKGEIRHIRPIKIAGKEAFILAKNNDTLSVIRFSGK